MVISSRRSEKKAFFNIIIINDLFGDLLVQCSNDCFVVCQNGASLHESEYETLKISAAHSQLHHCMRQIVRKVVRRGKGEDGVQDVSVDGSLQDANELEVDAEQFMSYAILGRESSKVGF